MYTHKPVVTHTTDELNYCTNRKRWRNAQTASCGNKSAVNGSSQKLEILRSSKGSTVSKIGEGVSRDPEAGEGQEAVSLAVEKESDSPSDEELSPTLESVNKLSKISSRLLTSMSESGKAVPRPSGFSISESMKGDRVF